jgi:Spy/CpxP family protein refolding chaperone
MKKNAIKGKIIPLLITGLCLIFAVQNNVIAQNKPVKNYKVEAKTGNWAIKIAKLTDEQKAKLKDLRIDHMKAIRLLKAQSQELKAHLKTLNLAEKPDNKAIFKTIDELTANHGEIMKHQITFKQSLKALLTPEQLKALELRIMNNRFQKGRPNQMWGQRGNSNFGRGYIMNNHQGFGGGQMKSQVQMQKRMQIIKQGQPPVLDSSK